MAEPPQEPPQDPPQDETPTAPTEVHVLSLPDPDPPAGLPVIESIRSQIGSFHVNLSYKVTNLQVTLIDYRHQGPGWFDIYVAGKLRQSLLSTLVSEVFYDQTAAPNEPAEEEEQDQGSTGE